jgi:predicted N-acetyltransferase YhbS
MAIEVRRLRPSDDRASFRSGDADLDSFFHKHAGKNQFALHIGTTYVALEGDEVVGFVTVAASSLVIKDLPKKLAKGLPRYPLPVLRLARMAVRHDRQRGGIGSALMRHVFARAHQQARNTGCAFVVVDAKETAVTYYERWGFEPQPLLAGALDTRPFPTAMFLELGAIPDDGDDGLDD